MRIWKEVLVEANKDVDCSEPLKPTSISAVKVCKDSGLLAVDGLCDSDPAETGLRQNILNPEQNLQQHAMSIPRWISAPLQVKLQEITVRAIHL